MHYQPREEGQGIAECAPCLLIVTVAIVIFLAMIGPVVGTVFSNVIGTL